MTAAVDLAARRRHVFQPGQVEAHTLFECSACEERTLGQPRCSQRQFVCRARGLEAPCPPCDAPVLVAELFTLEVPPPRLS